MNCIKRLRGFTALLISLLIVLCAVGFGNDVLADGTSDSVSLRSVWGEGATVDISGSGYQPNSTFTVTVNFNMSVSVDNYWIANSATSNGSSVTLSVTTNEKGSYSCGMNLSGSGFIDYSAEGQPVLFAFTGSSSTGSAAKAEPAAPKPDENKPAGPKADENKPAAPKPDEKKPAAPKPDENKPADPKADEKKAEEPKQAEPAEPKAAEPAKQEQNNNNNNNNANANTNNNNSNTGSDNNNSSKSAATSTPTAAPAKSQDSSSSSSSSNSGNSGSSATAAPTKSASTDSAATTTAPKTTEAPASADNNNSEKKTDNNTAEPSTKAEAEPTENPEETEPEDIEETEPSEPAAVKDETETADIAVVLDEGTDETGEPTPTPTAPIKVSGIITPHGRRQDGMSWLTFILIILFIGVVVRLAILKSQGVENSELVFEFIPLGAIKNKFKKDAAPVAEEKKEDEPKVVNGYLKKSDTAAIRPMYSNAASGSASRVRGGTKQTPRVNEPSTATGKVTTNKVSSNPSRKTTTSSSSSSSKTAFNHAQAMKELRAMEEAEKNGR